MFNLFNKKTSTSSETPQQEWQRKTHGYAAAVNNFVEKGLRDGWDNAGAEPDSSGREHLVSDLLKALKRNSKKSPPQSIAKLWPPAHAPLVEPAIQSQGQSVPVLALLDDGSIIARIGASYHDGHVVKITQQGIHKIPDVNYFGQGPNKRYFAIPKTDGVSIIDGWDGPETCFCPYPTGLEDVPEGYVVPKLDGAPSIDRLVPFPDGKRVLIIGDEGIFVLATDHARRLLPTLESQKDFYDYLIEENPGDPLSMDLSMSHGHISHDGRMIAVGSQAESHMIYDSDCKLIADIGGISEYPHYAVFSKNDDMVALNSCHFYNGGTIGVPTKLFGDYSAAAYELDPKHVELDNQARVYAATSSKDLFITGDAHGYVRGFDRDGKTAFRIFLGSSIGDIDISKDEKTLVVSTYAGFVALYDLEAKSKAPHQIGVGDVLELRRWVFWKDSESFLW